MTFLTDNLFIPPLSWLRYKTAPAQFATNKNRPGTDYPSKITEANQKGTSEPLQKDVANTKV